jgi:hypothetical protein
MRYQLNRLLNLEMRTFFKSPVPRWCQNHECFTARPSAKRARSTADYESTNRPIARSGNAYLRTPTGGAMWVEFFRREVEKMTAYGEGTTKKPSRS